MKSLYEVYDEITKTGSRWCHYSENNISKNVEEVFQGEDASLFIKDAFDRNGKSGALNRLHDGRYEMTAFRAHHTISAFLLGITLRDEMHISMAELPKVYKEPTRNFLYFWSLICLYHDLAFAIEEDSSQLVADVHTVEDFINRFEIQNSFLDDSEESALIRNYYKYRITVQRKIDHGIAGALLVYDALLNDYQKQAEEHQVEGKLSFESGGLKYSKEFAKHIKLIAITIAKHNMWRADETTISVYDEYKLQELIPQEDGSHKVYIDGHTESCKAKLLFLLGLVDTMEPIKSWDKIMPHTYMSANPCLALRDLEIDFEYRKSQLRMRCDEEHLNGYFEILTGLTVWLGTEVNIDQGDIVVRINYQSSRDKVAA